MSWDFMISGGAINLLTRCVSILGALQSARGGNLLGRDSLHALLRVLPICHGEFREAFDSMSS